MSPRLRARWLGLGMAAVVVAGGTTSAGAQSEGQHVIEVMKQSFKARGQAGLDRLQQDDAQAECSRLPADGDVPAVVAERIQAANLAAVRYPASGGLMGDWREGEKIAQSGQGMQFNEDPRRPAGGNCYACHELSPAEVSFGTIGPSLRGYGRLRGGGPDVQRYVYAKVYNSQAFRACSAMPRFGHHRILTEQQIKDVVGLLLDPASPVNR
jgi:sulfur-oxidizing protein SoxX